MIVTKPWKEVVQMITEKRLQIENQFDSFCKKVLKNALKDYYRQMNAIASHEIEFSSMSMPSLLSIYTVDEYNLSACILVGEYTIRIHDERIEKAVLKLEKRCRDIILLSFWQEMNDREIAQVLGIPRRTVQYLRHKALSKLKTGLGNGFI